MKALLFATIAIGAALVMWVHMNPAPQVISTETTAAPALTTPALDIERSELTTPEGNGTDPAVVDGPSHPRKTPSKYVGPKDDEEMRRMLADPEGRKQLLAMERKDAARMRPDLMEALSMGNDEYNRLLDVLAEQALEHRDAFLTNDSMINIDAGEKLREQHRGELAEQFGAETAKAFQVYEESMIARAFVGQSVKPWLKDDTALTPQQMSHLIAALHETNQQFEQELRAQYQGLTLSINGGTALGAIFMASPSIGRRVEEQVSAQMDDYQERVLRAAALVLRSDQFEVFSRVARHHLAQSNTHLFSDAREGANLD